MEPKFQRGRTAEVFVPHRRIALFIDGANLFVAAKVCGFDIDWKKFLAYYGKQGDLLRSYYYTGILPVKPGERDNLRPTLDWLVYNGFTMRTKPAKIFIDPTSGKQMVKGNMDIELCLDMMRISAMCTDVYLFSGDGDFTPLVKHVQDEGTRVHVISTIHEDNPMCADDLRRQCDSFHELSTLRSLFERD